MFLVGRVDEWFCTDDYSAYFALFSLQGAILTTMLATRNFSSEYSVRVHHLCFLSQSDNTYYIDRVVVLIGPSSPSLLLIIIILMPSHHLHFTSVFHSHHSSLCWLSLSIIIPQFFLSLSNPSSKSSFFFHILLLLLPSPRGGHLSPCFVL